MSPTFFLPCACIISSIISVMTGTSWTTIATIGIALMGIGDALGIPAPYTAGAIISGAYFGDKLSPMSDTTVLASSIAGADLFSHIRYMLYTTIPSILLSLVLYLIIGLCYDSKPVDISQYLTGLSHGFNISLFTMLVPAFTGWLIYRKTPSLITLLLSALSQEHQDWEEADLKYRAAKLFCTLAKHPFGELESILQIDFFHRPSMA